MNLRSVLVVMILTASPAAPVQAQDSLRTVTVEDSVGVLTGVTTVDTAGLSDPTAIKKNLGMMGRREIDAPRAWERRKNPQLAMLSSALLPGLGQVYNGRRLKVGVMVGFAYYYMSNIWLNWRKHERFRGLRDLSDPDSDDFDRFDRLSDFYREEARTFLWWSGAVWLLGILDAWIDAHLYDVRAYTPPRIEASAVPTSGAPPTTYITWSLQLTLK